MTKLEQLKQDYADGRNIFRRPSVTVLFEKITELEITNAALESKITAAGDLLEQISVWMWENQGMPEPMWVDQFTAVCQMFEPEHKHE